MLTWLPAPLIGVISVVWYTFTLLFCCIYIYFGLFLRFITRGEKSKRRFEAMGLKVSIFWAKVSDILINLTCKTVWEIDDVSQLSSQQWYLLMCNHQSWADIIVLEKVFIRQTSMLRFFVKKQLGAVPLIGTTCKTLNFPFMHRYTKEQLAKNPELQGKDLEVTQKACAACRLMPTTLINFVEGTRFTPKKHKAQLSPFKHLLKPKAGGTAFTIAAMEGTLKVLINTTIIYHGDKISAWDFFCGRIKKITVRFEVSTIPDDLVGDYQNDPQFRVHIQTWLNHLWQAKDQLIEQELQSDDK